MTSHVVQSLAQLESLYGPVGENSVRKEVGFVHPHYRALIEASPFAVLATAGPGGLDASPRGDPPGVVTVQDDNTLLIPERRGNNRIDSLRNILADPRVALLFLIPGNGETLRVNGKASITTDPALLERTAIDGKRPHCVIVVKVDSVFFQCARAIQRARLWDVPDRQRLLPTAGAILEALSDSAVDGEKYDQKLPGRQRSTLY